MIKTVVIWTLVAVGLCLGLGVFVYHQEKQKQQTEERITEIENRLKEIDRELEHLDSESDRHRLTVSTQAFGSCKKDGEEYPAIFLWCPKKEHNDDERGMQKLLPFDGGKLAVMGCEHAAELDEQILVEIYECKLDRDRLEDEQLILRSELVGTGYFEFDDGLTPIRKR